MAVRPERDARLTPRAVAETERDRAELDDLLDAIFERYGYDFREYAPASLRRRINRRVRLDHLTGVEELRERVVADLATMQRLVLDLSINVTAMFRDPSFYAALREHVVPRLRTYPFTRIWVAGCSTGEEVFSLAILLEEEGLYDRARIYATDINDAVLDQARLGVFPLAKMREYTTNYLAAGGRRAFSDYYVTGYDGAKFASSLLGNVVLAQHNLATDRSFNDFHAILCRNVMIYFERSLQQRVIGLFHESLVHFGALGLGRKESLRHTPPGARFEPLDATERLYRKVR